MKKRLLGYRRKSMVRDRADLVSPERQMHICELWNEMHGNEYIIDWFEDIEGHRSGRYEKNRSDWRQLMQQLDQPDVAGVIADSLDRIYRNVKEFGAFLERLKELDKKLILVSQSIDTTTAIGQAITMFMMVVYQLESDQTSERMIKSVRYKREILGRHWGTTPFGCDRDGDGQLIPTAKTYWFNQITHQFHNGTDQSSETEGWEQRRYYDALTRLYNLYAEGHYSYDAIALMLNQSGWRFCNRQGQPRLFDRDDIRRSIASWQLFRGELPLGEIRDAKGPVLPGGHDPILPIELCDQVGRIYHRRKKHFNRSSPESPSQVYLLSNILYCAVCQKPLKGAIQDSRRLYRHYGGKQGCPEKWVIADDIEQQIIDDLMALVDQHLLTEIKAEADRLARELFAKDDSTQPILAKLENQRERLVRLEDLYLDGDIDKPRYQIRKAEIDQTISQLETELYTATQTINFNQVLTRIISTLNQLPDAPPAIKKTLINSVFERLEIGNGQIIHLTPRPWVRPFF